MQSYQHHQEHHPPVIPSDARSVATKAHVPKEMIPSSSSSAFKPITTPPVSEVIATPSSPPSTPTKMTFKVKSKVSQTVLRFQCEPTYLLIQANIRARLAAATNNSATTTSKQLVIQYQDDDDDWCTLSNDDDVQEALHSAATRQDTLVRLYIQDDADESILTTAVSSLGGYISNYFGW
jgi:hypothetical protein